MSERTLKRIGVVLAVLVLAWIVVTLTSGSPEPGDAGGEMAAFLEGLTPEAATTVVFDGGGPAAGTVHLERGPGGAAPAAEDAMPTGWAVDGRPADSAQVARFLGALADAGTEAPVSVNPANHARMGVDDASARVLVVEGPEGADTLLVGNAGPSTGTVYARLPARDEVHLVRADLSSHAGRSAADWRSRAMAAADTAAVAALEVTRDGSSYRLERGDSAWTVDGEPADPTALRNLLAELADLQAQGFREGTAGAAEGAAGPTGGDAAGEAPQDVPQQATEDAGPLPEGEPDRTVTVWNADGEEVLTVRVWEPAESGGTTPEAVVAGPAALQPGTAFTLPSWRADRLAPEREGVVGA